MFDSALNVYVFCNVVTSLQSKTRAPKITFSPLGEDSLAVCTFYARTLPDNSEMDIMAISHYNVRHFARRNYQYYILHVTLIRKRRGEN